MLIRGSEGAALSGWLLCRHNSELMMAQSVLLYIDCLYNLEHWDRALKKDSSQWTWPTGALTAYSQFRSLWRRRCVSQQTPRRTRVLDGTGHAALSFLGAVILMDGALCDGWLMVSIDGEGGDPLSTNWLSIINKWLQLSALSNLSNPPVTDPTVALIHVVSENLPTMSAS